MSRYSGGALIIGLLTPVAAALNMINMLGAGKFSTDYASARSAQLAR